MVYLPFLGYNGWAYTIGHKQCYHCEKELIKCNTLRAFYKGRPMGVSVRVFIIEEDDTVHKLSHAAFERLTRQDPKEYLPKYAGQKVRYVLIAVQMKNRKPVDILHTEESFFNFDTTCRLDFSDRNEMIELVYDSLPPIEINRPKEKIVDARHHFAKKKYKRKFTWKPTPQIAETIVGMIFGKSR